MPWIAICAILNLLPVSGWHTHFTPDTPLGVAAALVLSPFEAAVVLFVGAFDREEFTGKTSLARALFNRSQISLSIFLGSWLSTQ